ncbi:MAG: serine hydrolase [Pseudomonadota bacterium]
MRLRPFYSLAASLMCAVTPGFADPSEKPISTAKLIAHPEVKGALSAIDAWIEGVQLYDNIPGISVGIVYDQELIWDKGYGYSNLEKKIPADADTLYSICSISKVFTAMGVMQLRDQGKLSLRDPVSKHLDWFNIKETYPESGPATIKGILTHSSGLPREASFGYWIGPDYPFPTQQQVKETIKDKETLYPSQTLFQYSNLGLVLAGDIIEEVSGQNYSDYMQSSILQPLKMDNTRTYFPTERHGQDMAIGYTGLHRDGKREPVKPFYTKGVTASAGFTSSVNDLAKFISWQFKLLDEKDQNILDVNTLREMHQVQWTDPDFETTRGLGFSVTKIGDKMMHGHGGGCPGYITYISLSPEEKLGVIVLTNASDGPAYSLLKDIVISMRTALEKATDSSREKSANYAAYEGNYEARPWGGEMAIRQWGNQLVAIQLPSDNLEEAITRLDHKDDTKFTRLTSSGQKREDWIFDFDGQGKAQYVIIHDSPSKRIQN